MRLAGVLMPIASLPAPYGIGDFGKDAYGFVDRLSDTGVKLWQILPLHPLGYGNSPYQPLSSYAGETLYISPELMNKDGLVTEDELRNLKRNCGAQGNPEHIHYERVRMEKEKLYRKAFQRFEKTEEYQDFI